MAISTKTTQSIGRILEIFYKKGFSSLICIRLKRPPIGTSTLGNLPIGYDSFGKSFVFPLT